MRQVRAFTAGESKQSHSLGNARLANQHVQMNPEPKPGQTGAAGVVKAFVNTMRLTTKNSVSNLFCFGRRTTTWCGTVWRVIKEKKLPCAAICLGPQGFTFMAEFIKKMITNGIFGQCNGIKFQADAVPKKTGVCLDFGFLRVTQNLSAQAMLWLLTLTRVLFQQFCRSSSSSSAFDGF